MNEGYFTAFDCSSYRICLKHDNRDWNCIFGIELYFSSLVQFFTHPCNKSCGSSNAASDNPIMQ
jgi:hypothetical protein